MITSTEPAADPFASHAVLRGSFEDGLERMLRHDLLGAFILVLANASFEAAMYARLKPVLMAEFEKWCERFDGDDPRATGAAVDDVAVFERLRDLGLDRLMTTRWRSVGPWQLQFNQLRALRPARMSNAVVSRLQAPFDASGFHFNKPFLAREVMWEGVLCDAPVRVLYNKFPFAQTHGLLVPDALRCRPQALDADAHRLVWGIARHLGERIPGIGFGYNAYGAYASVNHLHFQMFARERDHYPIESGHWRHNGGDEPYPVPVKRFDDPRQAWDWLQSLHANEQAYNLVYRPGRVYVASRAMQGSYVHSAWTGGFAWSELAGAITLFDEGDFERLTGQAIEQEYARMRPGGSASLDA